MHGLGVNGLGVPIKEVFTMFDQTIRIFLSSTFKDWQDERNKLHDSAFVKLRELCQSRSFSFQVVDLRWGVNETAGWDQRTQSVCLEEIKRCQRITPRPNFITMIGDRYGWRPLPTQLSQVDWRLIRERAGDLGDLLENWYVLDKNSRPTTFFLRPRVTIEERAKEYWQAEVEVPLRELFVKVIEEVGVSEFSRSLQETDISLTEKEVRLGTESAENDDWQAFAYFRDFRVGKERSQFGEPWVDLDGAAKLADPRSAEKLSALRLRLENSPKVATRTGTVELIYGKVDDRWLEWIDQSLFNDLAAAIEGQIDDYVNRDPHKREISIHLSFAEERGLNYVRRREVEASVIEYLTSNDRKTLVLHGDSGSGKTALMSRVQRMIDEQFSDQLRIVRFIGATGSSASLRSLVGSIHAQIAESLGTQDASVSMEGDPEASLRAGLALATKNNPLILLIDGIDQLIDSDRALDCKWVPLELPEHCHLIISCMSGTEEDNHATTKAFESLKLQLRDESFLELFAPQLEELSQMLTFWLDFYDRTLTQDQRSSVESYLTRCPRPLFLRVLVEIVRFWKDDDLIPELPTTIHGIIDTFLESLESDRWHGRTIVESTLGFLSASRSGLTEVELVDLLNRNSSVIDEFNQSSRYSYPDSRKRLPSAIWSRLLFDLSFFLGTTTISGSRLITFYHRQLGLVSSKRYLTDGSNPVHRELAAYFREQPTWLSKTNNLPNARKSFELPFQLRRDGGPTSEIELLELLGDDESVSAKIESALKIDLLNDYLEAESIGENQLAKLAVFFRDQFVQENSPLASAFTPRDLHAFYTFHGVVQESAVSKSRFYNLFLESLSKLGEGESTTHARRLILTAKIDLGGKLRREREFEQARNELDALPEDELILTKRDRGRRLYEIGYIHYLQDEYLEAANVFRESELIATEGNDPVGAAISRSVGSWANYFSLPSGENLINIGTVQREVLETFAQHQDTDATAFRWARNALEHLFNATYLENDDRNLGRYLKELMANPWVRDFKSPTALSKHKARYEMTRGNFGQAVKNWHEYFKKHPVEKGAEAGAWLSLDFGIALRGAGRAELSMTVFNDGLNQEEFGSNNAFWQKRIRDELTNGY